MAAAVIVCSRLPGLPPDWLTAALGLAGPLFLVSRTTRPLGLLLLALVFTIFTYRQALDDRYQPDAGEDVHVIEGVVASLQRTTNYVC